MKDYKIEMKGGLWEVILSYGEYSDKGETHLVFEGNSEDEIWNFLCRYIDDTREESDYLWGGEHLAIKWNDKQFLSSKYTGDRGDIYWLNSSISDVEIKRLNVIYFKN